MGDNVPLLNDYKREFFWKRFPQTLLGGVKLRLGYDAPAYIYLNQMILFVIPMVIGGMFSLVVELAGINIVIGYCVVGGCLGLYVLCAQGISVLLQRRSPNTVRPNLGNILADEDEVDFESCFGPETLDFILPVKKWKINILVHAVVSGVMGGLGFLYLVPGTLNALYYNNVGVTVVMYIFGWFALCVAQYPLTVTSPPESSVFRATDPYETMPLMRPFHLCLFFAVDLVWRSYPEILWVNQILHIIFVFLPFLWLIGMLPSVDALILWLGEQILSLVFGGSPVATDLRLILMLLASGITLVVAYFLPSEVGTVIFSACAGYVLSLDLSSLFNQILDWRRARQHNRLQSLNSQLGAKTQRAFGWRWGWREILVHFVTLLLIGGLSFTCAYLRASASVTVFNILGYGLVALRCLLKILGDVQSVCLFFGLWRNKLYPESIQNTSTYSKRKTILHRLSYAYRTLFHAVSPLLALSYLALFLAPVNITLPSFLFALGAVRSLRRIWQDTPGALLELSIVHIINSVLTFDPSSWWVTAGLGMQLLLVGAVLTRLFELLDKLYCFLVILITSYSLEKQRRSSSMPLIIVTVILFPIVFVIICLATVLSAPLLPLFTLPVFLIGFPRPLRFWPGAVGASANICSDSIYYKQLVPTLSTALSRAIANGSLGNPMPGCFYLVRFQDRMAWIQVLEAGFGFCTLSIKGMELQETSCHTVEAGRLDDIFETIFEHSGGFPICTFSRYPMNTLTPVDTVPVDTYSDARNVLTGIIDSPEILRSIDKSFVQTLVWVFLHHNGHKHHDSNNSAKSPTPPKIATPRETRLVNKNQVGDLATKFEGTKASDNWENRDSGRPSSIQSRPRSQAKPLDSSWGSLKSWEDDDSLDFDLDEKPKKQGFSLPGRVRDTHRPKESPALPGALEGFTDDEEEILKELNFGLSLAEAVNTKTGDPQTFPMHSMPSKSLNLAGSVQFSSLHSSRLSLPLKWRHLPVDLSRIASLFSRFPKDWYCHVLRHMDLSQGTKSSEEVADEIAADDALTAMYTHLTMACYAVVNVFGLSGQDVVSAGASHVYKVYSGDVPWSTNLDWLKEDEELFPLVIKAYRFAFKLAYDQAVLGGTEDLEEITEYLQQYETGYYFGSDREPEWAESVEKGVPQLFSLVHDASEGVYKGRVLTRQPVMAHIGRLNAEVVRSLWASLNLELLYFTNDDEERYSIQAHPTVLRNLTIQAADPPLGYPIYASTPVTVPTL
ncbi:pecanex-like protein 4 [Acanthaster planci]|uniref:Pecanex-like protein n=1 Tax=Acanthaster planci TaxID=133434 RepID=A0A8B7Y2A1_ACAPL|nr:pecanex-like protein 4 [Acanthaster planci]XP_022086061.1 pecanex-like protein 4 [Acanthaster planci]